MTRIIENKPVDALKKTFFFAIIFATSFFIFFHQVYSGDTSFPSDLPDHINGAIKMFEDHSLFISYPGLHFFIFLFSKIFFTTYKTSAILFLALCIISVAYMFLRIFNKENNLSVSISLTSILLLVTPIYIPWFNPFLYIGQGSPNIWHNPTLIALKPIAYVSFLATYYYFEDERLRKSYKYTCVVIVLLVVSLLFKPNFILAFFPALLIYILIYYTKMIKYYIAAGLFALPIIGVLVFQLTKTFGSEESDQIIISILGVWKLSSPNPIISIIITIAFPLSILFLNFRQAIKNKLLVLSWISYLVSVIQFAMFAEKIKFGHGNFSWGMNCMMTLLFLFSIVEFMRLKSETSYDFLKISFCAVVLTLHLFSGIYYLSQIMQGYSYN